MWESWLLGQGYWLMPNAVLFNKDLTDKQKLLYCLISSLCAEKGYCRASNEYIWELLNADARTIRRNISTLQESWFIKITVKNNNQREISLQEREDKNVLGVGQKCPRGVGQKCPHNNTIYNNTIEYNINDFSELYKNYYWLNKWINEKVCNKLLNLKLMEWITLEQIKVAMVLYNTEFRVKGTDYKYVKKFETWIKEFQPLTEEQIEESLTRIIRLHKERKKSDAKYWQSLPSKKARADLCEAFWTEKVNSIYKSEDTSKTILHFT